MFLQGKLTYASIAIFAAASVGLTVSADEVDTLYKFGLQAGEAAGVIGAVYGRWRAKR